MRNKPPDDLTDQYRRLRVYRERLACCVSWHDASIYEQMITNLEGEIAVRELIHEALPDRAPIRPYKVTTDSLDTVLELVRDSVVQIRSIDKRWAWRYMKRMWVVEYTEL